MECTNTQYKKQVDDYYNASYIRVTEVATNILSRIKRQDLANELVNFSYIYMMKSSEKPKVLQLVNEGKVEGVVINCMRAQIAYPTTPFKKEFVFEDVKIEFDEEAFADDDETDFDDILEYEFEHQSKMNHLTAFRETLNSTDKILFDLTIVGEYTTSGKLERYLKENSVTDLGVNRTSCYFQIKRLRERIKESYNDRNSDI